MADNLKNNPPLNSKYTKELLEPIVASSTSIADVLRKLGLKLGGGSYAWVPRVIKQHGIDCSHFLGQRKNRGNAHSGGTDKLHWSEVLVYDRLNGFREKTSRLRRALIDSGVVEKCVECGQLPEWNGKPLVLQIEHRNGDFLDNRPGNVCFLCPNCHSQTPTFGFKNAKRQAKKLELREAEPA